MECAWWLMRWNMSQRAVERAQCRRWPGQARREKQAMGRSALACIGQAPCRGTHQGSLCVSAHANKQPRDDDQPGCCPERSCAAMPQALGSGHRVFLQRRPSRGAPSASASRTQKTPGRPWEHAVAHPASASAEGRPRSGLAWVGSSELATNNHSKQNEESEAEPTGASVVFCVLRPFSFKEPVRRA